jgi:ankyrin repeat protein
MHSPIVQTVAKNLVPETTALLDAGAPVDSQFPAALWKGSFFEPQQPPDSWPLTVFAARHRAGGTLKLLLDRGAKIPGEHLGHALTTFAPLKDQAAAADVVKAILQTVDVAKSGTACIGAILSAASTASLPVIEAMLAAGASLNERDENGRSVLSAMLRTSSMAGLRYGKTRLPVVDLLISRGAPVDVADEKGPPLASAIAMGSFELALSLLRAGSPGVGRLTPDKTERLADVVSRARALRDAQGSPPADLFALADLNAWDLMLELGELGMNLHVSNFNWKDKNAWKALRERAPFELQVKSLPLIDDQDLMMRTVASEATNQLGIARLNAALELGADLNQPDAGGEFAEPTVLGAALAANAPVEVLELLLSRGASLKSPEGRWPTAISAAVHVSKLEWLASKGVPLDEYTGTWGTPLQRAVELKAEASAHFLVKQGARIDWVNPRGETPLWVAEGKRASPELLAALTPPPAPPVDVASLGVERTARGALSKAIALEDLDAVRPLVDARSVNAPDARGTTPLALAAEYGWIPGVQFLLERGANPDTPTRSGVVPFTTPHLAVQRVLERAGAQTKTRAVSSARVVPFRHKALLERGDLRGVAEAIARGMDVDFPVATGKLPLMVAIDRDDAAMVELLLLAGADPDAQQDKQTCVEYATASEKTALVALMVKAGGTPPPAPDEEVDDFDGGDQRVPAFEDAAGKVALFVNAGLVDSDDPDAFDGHEPPFWVDHDHFENVDLRDGNLEAIRALSYSGSFADAAIEAIRKLNVRVTHVFALYEGAARLKPGPLPDFWKESPGLYVMEDAAYVGAFSYEKSSKRR